MIFNIFFPFQTHNFYKGEDGTVPVMEIGVVLGKCEKFVFVSREVGFKGKVDTCLKIVNVASVRAIEAAIPSKECSFDVMHGHLMRFNSNVVSTEAVQNGTF